MYKLGFFYRLFNLRKHKGIFRVLYIYRYFSCFFTSLFYLVMPPSTPVLFKLGVLIALFIAAKIITDFYIKNRDSVKVLEVAVLVETLGITLLLIPTGGIKSPFVWYALNPVLVAASFLPLYFCWVNLTFYLFSEAVISIVFFQQSDSISQLIENNFSLVLVFILITLAVQMLSRLTAKLDQQGVRLKKQSQELQETNRRLELAIKMYRESMEHIMALYQVVEAFHSQDSPKDLLKNITYYTVKLTKASYSFFWAEQYEDEMDFIIEYGTINQEVKAQVLTKCREDWQRYNGIGYPSTVNIEGFAAVITKVKSSSRCYGMLGIIVDDKHIQKEECTKQLNFLSDLSGMVLERHHLEAVADRFLIVEEQNRIANEIHDSVSQRLFGIVCSVVALKSRFTDMSVEELKDQFELIRQSADIAMQELRSSIYRLSSRKNGKKAFSKVVKGYLDNISKLNNVSVDLKFEGDEETLSSSLRKALYRIIREATGNAIKHGKCSRIKVVLKIESFHVSLSILDNGNGFDLEKLKDDERRGLGIYNIQTLAQSFRGDLSIESEVGKGTKISVTIPNIKERQEQEGIAL